MTEPEPTPPPQTLPRWAQVLLALAFLALGLYIVGIYAEVVPYTPRLRCQAVFCDMRVWPVLTAGLAFTSAGLLLGLPERWGALRSLAGLAALVALLATLVGTIMKLVF